ncbi:MULTISPECIES: putative immunity protein [Hungatella]|jgi:hypothetical protein|uniref:putative immunity protein n=1 Tax=Hungatella TaxID=1649459 RepID=UPI0011DE483B|nr:hypothetical protein [Hungatella hathewayi]
MPKLRKMLGDVNSAECIALMRLIETQNEKTLAGWAVGYAKDNFLGIYENECPGNACLRDTILVCEEYLKGSGKLSEIKPVIKEAGQLARNMADNPTAQAAARAVSTACASVHTPTSALGFLFYGAAAAAYSQAGLEQGAEVYDQIASKELEKAVDSLKQVCVPDELHPVKVKWNC